MHKIRVLLFIVSFTFEAGSEVANELIALFIIHIHTCHDPSLPYLFQNISKV